MKFERFKYGNMVFVAFPDISMFVGQDFLEIKHNTINSVLSMVIDDKNRFTIEETESNFICIYMVPGFSTKRKINIVTR